MNRRTFGTFELDLATGELRRSGIRLKLQDKPFQLLTMLLERPGELVAREDVCRRLWPADTFVDFDHGLNTAVRKLRHALGDSADNPRFVETVARRGYRFIAPVTAPGLADAAKAVDQIAAAVPQMDSPSTLARRHGTRRRLAAAATLVLMLGSVGWMATRRTREAPSAPAASMNVAVLPFKVLASSEADTSWGIGIADAIIARLANVRTLRVRPTTAVFKYAAETTDPQRAGAELGAAHVLTGTLHKREHDYRVTVLLSQTSDGAAIWGNSYDVPRADLPSIESLVAAQVAEALRVELTAVDGQRRRAPRNPAAYEPYLEGRGHLDIRSEANLRASIESFRRALALDPDYALAHAGLATALSWFSVRYEHEPEALTWGRQADEEAYRALTLDPKLAEAHLAMASTAGTLYGHFNWGRVLAEADAALAIDPSMDLAFSIRGRALYHLGLFDAANRAAATALSFNPSVEARRLQVAIDLFGGRFDEVRTRGEALMQESTAPVLKTYVATALFYLGEPRRAAEMLDSVKRGDVPDARSQAVLAGVLASSGRKAEARTIIDHLIRGPYMDHHVAYSLAGAYAQLDLRAEALTWLRKAFDEGFPCYPWFERDPMLTPLRQDRRYTELMRQLRTRFEAARSQYDDTATH